MSKKKTRPTAKQGTSRAAAEARRRRFVEAYITNGGNATEAAVEAGYSPRSAGQQGSRLLKDVKISAAIQARREALMEKYELNSEMVTRSIVQELTFDPAKLYNEDGSLRPLHEIDEDTRMALTGVEFVQVGSPDAPVFVKKVKWAQRHQARDHAMRFLGMFERDNKQKNDPLSELLKGLAGNVFGAGVAAGGDEDED